MLFTKLPNNDLPVEPKAVEGAPNAEAVGAGAPNALVAAGCPNATKNA